MSGRRAASGLLVACACLVLAACGSAHHSAQSPAARYLIIAAAGNRALDQAFDDGLAGKDANDLAAAEADLRSAAATERRFDQQLAAIALPPDVKRTADALVAVNQARADLTSRLARLNTLVALHRAETQLAAANKPVEAQVSAIRAQLGLPPPPP